jgi:hypothetical protein
MPVYKMLIIKNEQIAARSLGHTGNLLESYES